MHLITATNDGGQDLEDLLGHKVIIRILFQTIDAVLQDLTSELSIFGRIHAMNISDCAESDD